MKFSKCFTKIGLFVRSMIYLRTKGWSAKMSLHARTNPAHLFLPVHDPPCPLYHPTLIDFMPFILIDTFIEINKMIYPVMFTRIEIQL